MSESKARGILQHTPGRSIRLELPWGKGTMSKEEYAWQLEQLLMGRVNKPIFAPFIVEIHYFPTKEKKNSYPHNMIEWVMKALNKNRVIKNLWAERIIYQEQGIVKDHDRIIVSVESA